MANPPITIGPFTNVPAPGSPIRSDWPQAISTWAAAADPKIAAMWSTQIVTAGATFVATSDSGAILYHTFHTPFAAPPAVVAVPADYATSPLRLLIQANVTATMVSWACFNAAGTPLGNTACRVALVAVGPRA